MPVSRQAELAPTPAAVLDENRGVISLDMLPQFELESDRRSNVAMLAGRLGAAFIGSEPAIMDIGRDPVLEIVKTDYERAYPYALKRGLIYPWDDSRRAAPTTRPHLVVVVTEGERTLSPKSAPGVVGRYDGVAVSSEEYDSFVRSATGLADKVETSTLKKHGNNPNREEKDQRVGLHVTEVMEAKLSILSKLDENLIAELGILRRINRDARLVWRTTYLSKNLDRDRRLADEIIHDIIEIAATNLEYDTKQINAVHRAAFSNRYHRGSSRELAQAWRTYTGVFGQYKNAIRGKVSQSRSACELEIRRKMPATLPEAA